MSAKAETVSCPCGASIKVEIQDQEFLDAVCPECGQLLEVMVSVDPRTKARRVGILVKAASMAPRHRAKSKTGGKGEEVHTAKCTCGAQLTITPKGPDAIYTCSACEAEYTASLKQGRTGSVVALVLRPVLAMPLGEKPEPARPAPKAPPPAAKAPPAKAAPAPARPAPAPKPGTKALAPKPAAKPAPAPAPAGSGSAKENMLLMTKGDLGAQEVVEEEGGRKVTCFCGVDLPLRGEFHREILKCGSCGSAFRVFAATNPKTNGSMLIMIPRDAGKGAKA